MGIFSWLSIKASTAGAMTTQKKRAIGQVWEEKSDGHCLFVMPKGPDWNAILAKLGE
jgi:hypothetical protein